MNSTYYPTPQNLIRKMCSGLRWRMVNTILEPEAGSGHIVDWIIKETKYEKDVEIDCIEIDFNLRAILKEKGYPIVARNFLDFETYKKYDLIVMNPPFDQGVKHLLKAMEIQKAGGDIICILNAESIRNPYSNERKVLIQKLEECDADIEYIADAFTQADKKTSVEIALIKVHIAAKEQKSLILRNIKLQMNEYEETQTIENYSLVSNDYIKAAVTEYNIQTKAGIQLIKEYESIKPLILSGLKENDSPLLDLTIHGSHNYSINSFIQGMRLKYWEALFQNPKFTMSMTTNLLSEYRTKVHELSMYEFNYSNIKDVQLDIVASLSIGIEEAIMELFHELTDKHSYYDECKNNIHLYNGWKTNKAWYINKKVIIPLKAYSDYSGRYKPDYYVKQKLSDIEKALNYLKGIITNDTSINDRLESSRINDVTKNIKFRYFNVTFYKKGTCHIVFTDEELLKKLNIFGGQRNRWLPPGYGKKSYQNFTEEEKTVIDSFEGERSYKETEENFEYFIYKGLDLIEDKAC